MAQKTSSKKKAVTKRRPPKAAAKVTRAVSALAGVLVVNMIPKSLSGETNQDSEPMLAVNPTNPKHIVGTAFTPDPMGGAQAPIFVSTDGGNTWTLNATVPGGDMTGDISVAFSGTADKLFAGILRQDAPPNKTRMAILRANDFSSLAAMNVLDDRLDPDQPFTQAVTVAAGPDAGKECVLIGNNDFAAAPQTATLDISAHAGAASPIFKKIRLEKRSTSTAGQNGPQVRPIAHSNGTLYAAFYGWRSMSGNWEGNTLKVTADVVVVRDDSWASGATPFEALKDPGDGLAGRLVAKHVKFAFNRNGIPVNGQQRLGGTLSIAVDPRNSSTVYLAWGDDSPQTGFMIHVRRSTDKGVNWSPADLLAVPKATNAAIAINADGVVGLLYQQLTGVGAARRWVTHFRRTNDGQQWSDLVLAKTPANFPAATFDPYLGDYDHLLAAGKDFYGIFSASNAPNQANFPSGVKFQRNANFTTNTLLGIDNTTPVNVSIDPFFFKVNG